MEVIKELAAMFVHDHLSMRKDEERMTHEILMKASRISKIERILALLEEEPIEEQRNILSEARSWLENVEDPAFAWPKSKARSS